MRKLPKDVLKMASGLISPSGLAGHRRPLCNEGLVPYSPVWTHARVALVLDPASPGADLVRD